MWAGVYYGSGVDPLGAAILRLLLPCDISPGAEGGGSRGPAVSIGTGTAATAFEGD